MKKEYIFPCECRDYSPRLSGGSNKITVCANCGRQPRADPGFGEIERIVRMERVVRRQISEAREAAAAIPGLLDDLDSIKRRKRSEVRNLYFNRMATQKEIAERANLSQPSISKIISSRQPEK